MNADLPADSYISVRAPSLRERYGPYRGQYAAGQETLETEIVLHRSRFIGCVEKVQTKDEVTDFIKARKAKHPQANHHVWAYVIDAKRGTFHFSDDGEPGGTAGSPVLGVLSKYRLERTAIVVTRFFGGVKLGINGLIEAYRRCAEETVLAVGIARFSLYRQYACALEYTDWNVFRHLLSTLSVAESGVSVQYAEKVECSVRIVEDKARRLREELDRYVAMRKITGYSEGMPVYFPDETETAPR